MHWSVFELPLSTVEYSMELPWNMTGLRGIFHTFLPTYSYHGDFIWNAMESLLG